MKMTVTHVTTGEASVRYEILLDDLELHFVNPPDPTLPEGGFVDVYGIDVLIEAAYLAGRRGDPLSIERKFQQWCPGLGKDVDIVPNQDFTRNVEVPPQ